MCFLFSSSQWVGIRRARHSRGVQHGLPGGVGVVQATRGIAARRCRADPRYPAVLAAHGDVRQPGARRRSGAFAGHLSKLLGARVGGDLRVDVLHELRRTYARTGVGGDTHPVHAVRAVLQAHEAPARRVIQPHARHRPEAHRDGRVGAVGPTRGTDVDRDWRKGLQRERRRGEGDALRGAAGEFRAPPGRVPRGHDRRA